MTLSALRLLILAIVSGVVVGTLTLAVAPPRPSHLGGPGRLSGSTGPAAPVSATAATVTRGDTALHTSTRVALSP